MVTTHLPASLLRARSLLALALLSPALATGQAPVIPDVPEPAAHPPSPPAEPADPELPLDEDELLKVFSASQQEEPLWETPVPVTVVTSEMIRSIGARNLQDVLLAFVPGMTLVADHNELNVAMRGVYASSQQKILVLLDGHRLNSRAYSMANPDHSISLDNIRQIEILRGPGSSLYGNVALTAVINLVTKSGREADGLTLRGGLGNFGQETGSLVFGKEFETGDFLVWGSFYKADGEKRSISAAQDYSAAPTDGYAILQGIRDPASYDVGVRARAGYFSLLAATRYGKYIEPFSAGGVTGEVYDYGSFRTLSSLGPGLGSGSNHVELAYARPLSDRVFLSVSGYYDTNHLAAVLSTNPAANAGLHLVWNEDDIGGIAQLRTSYEAGKVGQGNITLGFQFDRMRLLDSSLAAFSAGEWVKFADTSDRRVLEPGTELIYSGFAQLKQRVMNKLIFNLGVRYDLKDRHKGVNIEDLSPRLAVIYTPSSLFDVKLSYAQSFVDAPYWYRYNIIPAYQGAESLTPEHLQSVQLTPSLTLFNGKLKTGLNVFYNHLSDVVYRNINALPGEQTYLNAGVLDSVGVEHELSISLLPLKIRTHTTYQHLLETKDYPARGTWIYNVPPLVANLVCDFNPFYSLTSKVWFNANVRYVSRQLSPIDITFRNPATNEVIAQYYEPDYTVRPYGLINVGVRLVDLVIEGVEGFSVDATVYNLLDHRYEQGGSTVHPYPQPGRWGLVRLTYHLQ